MKEDNKNKQQGTQHPLSILANQAYQVFSELGFEIAMGPELESEWYNFDVLNVPKDHPARDMQDTFWIKTKPDSAVANGLVGASPDALAKVRTQPNSSQGHTGSSVLR